MYVKSISQLVLHTNLYFWALSLEMVYNRNDGVHNGLRSEHFDNSNPRIIGA